MASSNRSKSSFAQLQVWASRAVSEAPHNIKRTITYVREKGGPLWQKYRPRTLAGYLAAAGLAGLAVAALCFLLVVGAGSLTALAWTLFAFNLIFVVTATTGLAVGGVGALIFAGFASVVGLFVLAGAAAMYIAQQVLVRSAETVSVSARVRGGAPAPLHGVSQDQQGTPWEAGREATGKAEGEAGAGLTESVAQEQAQPGKQVGGAPLPGKVVTVQEGGSVAEQAPGTPPAVSDVHPKSAGASPEVRAAARQAAVAAEPLQEPVPAPLVVAPVEQVLRKPLKHTAPAFHAAVTPDVPVDVEPGIPAPKTAAPQAQVAATGAGSEAEGPSAGAAVASVAPSQGVGKASKGSRVPGKGSANAPVA